MTENTGTPPAGTGDGTDWKAEAEKWKTLSRQWEDKAKTNHAALEQTKQQLQELKTASDNSKSDMDKLMEQISSLREDNVKTKREAMLSTVKSKTGLTDKQIAKLAGETVDELLADATETFDWKPDEGGEGGGEGGDDDTVPLRRPKPELKAHPSTPGNEPEETDPIKLAAMVPRMF